MKKLEAREEASDWVMWCCEDERLARSGGVGAGGSGRLEVWRSAGVAASLIQMVENFSDDFMLDNEGNDA